MAVVLTYNEPSGPSGPSRKVSKPRVSAPFDILGRFHLCALPASAPISVSLPFSREPDEAYGLATFVRLLDYRDPKRFLASSVAGMYSDTAVPSGSRN
jgi:hypothetical protein